MPTVIQHRSTFSNGTTSQALAFLSNNAAGNLLAYASGGGPASPVSMNAATDSNANTIAAAVVLAGNGAALSAARWDYVASANSGANTVTAHAPNSLDIHIHIWEISGCVTSSPVRATGSIHNAVGSVATSTSTPLIGDAVLAFFYDNASNNPLVAGSGYSPSDVSANTTGGDSAISEYKTATVGGTQTATCSGNGTDNLDQVIVVFIQASTSVPTLDLTNDAENQISNDVNFALMQEADDFPTELPPPNVGIPSDNYQPVYADYNWLGGDE